MKKTSSSSSHAVDTGFSFGVHLGNISISRGVEVPTFFQIFPGMFWKWMGALLMLALVIGWGNQQGLGPVVRALLAGLLQRITAFG